MAETTLTDEQVWEIAKAWGEGDDFEEYVDEFVRSTPQQERTRDVLEEYLDAFDR